MLLFTGNMGLKKQLFEGFEKVFGNAFFYFCSIWLNPSKKKLSKFLHFGDETAFKPKTEEFGNNTRFTKMYINLWRVET